MKLLVINLCTTGVLKNQFIEYCSNWGKKIDLYCITNTDVKIDKLNSKETIQLFYKRNKKLSYLSIKSYIKAKKFIKKINPDEILFFGPSPVNIFLFNVAKRFNVSVQIHDPLVHSGTKFFDRIIHILQMKLYMKYTKNIFVASNSIKEDIENNKDYKNQTINVVPLALLPSMKIDNISKIQKKVDVLFYGRIEVYKGIDTLIEASKLLDKNINFYILGKGEPYFKIDGLSNIFFENRFIPNEELISYILASKVIVMPYKDATGSMTIAQAFYYEKPVIATNVGCFPEYVKNGGIIVNPDSPKELADAIEKILNNQNYRKELSKNGKAKVDKYFNINNICNQYLEKLKKEENK